MQTRRDQLQAYRFQNKRALAALVTGEPNVLEPPMRRLTAMTISGILVAVLIGVGAAVLALIKPSGGDDWKQAGAIIDERGTGARYVLYPGNILHPVLNYASAVLVVGAQSSGGSKPHIVFVDSGDIKSAGRGSLIGIDGLPDSVPGASGLVGYPWTVCSSQTGGSADHLSARVSLDVGSDGARPAVPSTSAVFVHAVSDPATTTWLLSGGRRYAVTSTTVATALDLGNQKPLQVGTAFLSSVPIGPALSPPKVPAQGTPSAVVSVNGQPATVGRLLHTTDSDKYYLVLNDGTASLNSVQTALFRTVTFGAGGQTEAPIDTTENAVLNIKPSGTDWPGVVTSLDGLPSTIPTVDARPAQRGGVCAVYRSGSSVSLTVPISKLPSYSPPSVVESTASAHGVADEVDLEPGHAALVQGGKAKTPFLVASPGKKFAMPSDAVLTAFGYSGVTPTKIPSQLLSLVPLGNPMDPIAARRPVSG